MVSSALFLLSLAHAAAPPLVSPASLDPIWTPEVAVESVPSALDAWCVARVSIDASGGVTPLDLGACPGADAVGRALRAWRYAPLEQTGGPLVAPVKPGAAPQGKGWVPSGWTAVIGPEEAPFAMALPVAPVTGPEEGSQDWRASDPASGVTFQVSWHTREAPLDVGEADAVLEDKLAKMARLSTRSSLTQGQLADVVGAGAAGRERVFGRGEEVHIGRVFASSDDVYTVEARFMNSPAGWEAAWQAMATFHVASVPGTPGPVAPRRTRAPAPPPPSPPSPGARRKSPARSGCSSTRTASRSPPAPRPARAPTWSPPARPRSSGASTPS